MRKRQRYCTRACARRAGAITIPDVRRREIARTAAARSVAVRRERAAATVAVLVGTSSPADAYALGYQRGYAAGYAAGARRTP